MNQPNQYMSDTVLPGFRRSFYSADVSLKDVACESVTQPIVLCIDQQIDDVSTQTPEQSAVSNSVSDTFHAAIALSDQDPLLQCVAKWLNDDVEWYPLSDHKPASVDYTLSGIHSSTLKIGLCVGQSKSDLPSFPEELNEFVLIQEHSKEAKICLAQLYLSDDDYHRIEPGSFILLPDTFKQNVNVQLFDRAMRICLSDAVLDHRRNTLFCNHSRHAAGETWAKADVASRPENSRLIRVVCENSITVDFAQWQRVPEDDENQAIRIQSLVAQSVVVQRIDGTSITNYSAKVIEVGAGLAVLLDNAL